MKMNVLIVSCHFHPQKNPRSYRTTELAKELVRQGHQVTVYIPESDYDYSVFRKETKIVLRFMEINLEKRFALNGNKIIVILKKIANRLLSTFLAWPAIRLVWKLPELFSKINGYDLLISIAVPHPIHWGVTKSLRKNPLLTKTWIADCGDPFMLCQTDTFKNPFYFKTFEKSFCRRADYVTIPVESGKAGYYPEFWHKIRIIPQGFNFAEIRKVGQYIPNEIVTFAYAGVFIPGIRDPRPVLDFLAAQPVDFRFFVYTNQSNLLENHQQILGEKLLIHEYIDREELIYRMSSYDFVLNLENGTSVHMPSKLIDYALCGRPILSIFSQNIHKEKFLRFLSRDYSQQHIIDRIDDYNIVNVATKFIDLAENKHVQKDKTIRMV